ncbi:MAG TPA: hypothetical protein DCF68_03750 [Cyanothece sp. UBA12306]|nr:hypothetical protein [Cyanothece sp. UBA12306]
MSVISLFGLGLLGAGSLIKRQRKTNNKQ